MSTPISHLSEISACDSAVDWVKSTKCRSLESAWKKCKRGDWMLWYAAKKAGPVGDERRKKLVLASCECARLALPIYEKRYPDDKRVRECIETAEKWARNEATLEALKVSRRNCYEAAYSTYYAANVAEAPSDATAATYAAYYAASAASDAAVCASDPTYAYASAATSAAAAAAAYSATKKKVLAECADIVRKHYPTLPT